MDVVKNKSQAISKFQVPKSGLILLLFFFGALITCKKEVYNPKLPAYLRAENELRSRISPEQGLSDSIVNLQKRYRINPDKELKRLEKNPDAWLKLIKELTDAR